MLIYVAFEFKDINFGIRSSMAINLMLIL